LYDAWDARKVFSVKAKILLVDDEENVLTQMRLVFAADYQTLTSSTEEEAIQVFSHNKPAVVISDLSLKPHDPSDLGGMRLLERMLSEEPATRVIIVTGNNQQTNALRAIQLGASDYYIKPIRVDELKVMVQRALHLHILQQKLYHSSSRVGEGVMDTEDRISGSVVLSPHPVLKPIDSRLASDAVPTGVNLKVAKRALEIDFVKKALSRNQGIVSRAARELGISRVNLYELIQKYGIRIQEFKQQRSNRNQQSYLNRREGSIT
jgi:DNA-binding NtrC family response regulator